MIASGRRRSLAKDLEQDRRFAKRKQAGHVGERAFSGSALLLDDAPIAGAQDDDDGVEVRREALVRHVGAGDQRAFAEARTRLDTAGEPLLQGDGVFGRQVPIVKPRDLHGAAFPMSYGSRARKV
jgi:hypothetical protein